ncbi:MAG: gamma-glutamyltransferase [Cytophagales bacterium]|nr:gamma-glutamyltransferase [Cytophagales bacterium]
MKFSNLILSILIPLVFTCRPVSQKETSNRLGFIAENAMVVSAHPIASQIGIETMKNGGNAIDAAVAVHFALAVVYPAAGNIGGGGFLIYRTNGDAYYSLDYREKAPALAHRNMYLDDSGAVIPESSRFGHSAAGVPGSVDGMWSVHKKFGTRPWQELLQPSIDLARDGYVLTENEADHLNRIRESLKEYNTILPEFLIRESWKAGDSIHYLDLAKTLERISRYGRSGFYKGETAKLIVEEMKRGNGLISLEDLRNYSSVWRAPITFNYRNYTITSMGPPSSGGVAIGQLFSTIAHFPLKKWGINDIKTIHAIVESEKLAYADRAKYLGDPDFVKIPVHELLDKGYNRARAHSINLKSATVSDRIQAGQFYSEPEETTHFSIVDQFGNAVSSTTTLNGGFGNRVVVGGAGFFLNNEMDDFSAKPGAPNMYGLTGGEANAIEPKKRMLSSMTPTIVEKNGHLFMVVGTPGGSTIITSVFQTILNVIEFDLNMQGAVDFPRFHHQWKPDIIQSEAGRFDSTMVKELEGLGHKLSTRSAIGRVDAILVLDNNKLEGGADPRGDDAAAGF